jgi:transposase
MPQSGAGFNHDWPRILRTVRKNRAHLVLIDETGLLLAPLVRRTLAPRGHTPVLTVKASHRDKLSLIAALTLSPRRHRVGLHYRGYPKQSVNHRRTAVFLQRLLRQIRGPMVVLWDRGNMHRGPALRELERKHPRLTVERLPPYAPELNPVEHLWNHLKYDDLVNYAPRDLAELIATARQRLERTRHYQNRLKTFFHATPLNNRHTYSNLVS